MDFYCHYILPTDCFFFFLSDRDLKRAFIIYACIYFSFRADNILVLLVILNRSAYLSLKAPRAKPAPLWAAYEYQLQLRLIKISRGIFSRLITEEESCIRDRQDYAHFVQTVQCTHVRVYTKSIFT